MDAWVESGNWVNPRMDAWVEFGNWVQTVMLSTQAYMSNCDACAPGLHVKEQC